MIARNSSSGGRPRWGVALLIFWLGIGLTGCDSLIDVENPNNVSGDDLLNPSAAGAVANGALYTVQEGYGYMLAPYSTVSDELIWIGSRDAWFELELGTPENPLNEFTDAAFPFFAQGRWMADEAIRLLEEHQANNELETTSDLARTYLYAAISYVTIADWMDNFALSDRRDAAAPIGEDNMSSLYATAIDYVDRGLAIVGGSGSDLEWQLLSMRARARYAQSVWAMVGSRPINTSSPIVNNAQAAADAAAALAVNSAVSKQYLFDYEAATVWSDIGWQVNSRLELRISNEYIVPASDNNTRDMDIDPPINSIALLDPVDGTPDPRLLVTIQAFEVGLDYADLVLLSNRENHLIIAENALANSQTATFESNINAIRTNGLSAFASGGAVSDQAMLIHERRVNLFLQGRRLNDMYRFGIQSPSWQASRSAVTNPGTFLPITKVEIDANCHLNPDFACN